MGHGVIPTINVVDKIVVQCQQAVVHVLLTKSFAA